ncbi:tetratricopeptide repeat protein [Limnofasciculus baicalensis]|uniref:Tetratricopeptide repeat protein n=1 Tax=Limnofasciculus baicalensis BBK-W-15 TaxID=2699891 RepID=A0AAE3KKZ4_9CYAN|nr:tetratricopeptide repeat protein [Limnofasciculus baicalensis]MCP2727544.1 tetratricopeptide repeat protein [Limnofasciculus baicalensis BBK-W-15]
MTHSMSGRDSEALLQADRYFQLIDEIVQTTLQGKIRSKEQVYQILVSGIRSGSGEIFERCLAERLSSTQEQIDNPVNELKQGKATRTLRAINTISSEWDRVQEKNRVADTIASVITSIIDAEPPDRFTILLRVIDPNQQQVLNTSQLTQLAKTLQQKAIATADPEKAKDILQLSGGISAGLSSWRRLENDLVSWIYDQSRGSVGFEGQQENRGPWALWAKKVNSPLPQLLFESLAYNQPIGEWLNKPENLELAKWVELALLLQYLQRGLVTWFDKMVYNSKVSAKLSISTYIVFTFIWSQLANGLSSITFNQRDRLVNGCFQVTLQVLRAFSQRDYFPLYGGVFASLSGNYLRNALDYLDEPLRRVDGTQEKARILTLLGYSQRAQGQYSRAISFHEQALEIARKEGDRICEIANFNHLSRTCVAQKKYSDAINYSQRALILARQVGDKLGEANALTNLGYSEVFQAQDSQEIEAEVYESAIHYLEQGRQLLERVGDRQSQSLCLSSLGIACVVTQQHEKAITYLEQGWQAAQFSGDLYLQGVNLAYLSQAFYSLQDLERTIYTGGIGAYLLEQIGSEEWRQPAGLLIILKGQMGTEAFQALLAKQRSKIIPIIGVDGYDYIPQMLEKYRDSI